MQPNKQKNTTDSLQHGELLFSIKSLPCSSFSRSRQGGGKVRKALKEASSNQQRTLAFQYPCPCVRAPACRRSVKAGIYPRSKAGPWPPTNSGSSAKSGRSDKPQTPPRCLFLTRKPYGGSRQLSASAGSTPPAK